MEQYTSIVFSILCIAVYLLLEKAFKRRKGVFPPGPRGWPLVGHLFHFGRNTMKQMQHFHSQYGKTVHFRMASHDVVVCADIDLVKKYYTKDVFQARPASTVFNRFTDPGLVMYNGDEWRSAKRFAMKALKGIGFGRTDSEKLIYQEIDHFISALDKERTAGPVTIAKFTGPAASNVVALFVIGERFDYDNETRKMLDKAFLRPLEGKDSRPTYFGFLSFVELSKYLQILPGVAIIKYLQTQSKSVMKERVKAISSTYNLADEPNNYIEMYLKATDDNQSDPDFDKNFFNETRLINVGYTFFVAGSATTQEYLEWWFLLMANHPCVQEKMRQEIDSVLGGEKATLAHRTQMPYTEAVIHEVHRFASLIILNLPHVASEDAEFGPYFLPKGTQLIINMHAIHHDPEYFEEPDEFKPERFLSEDGRKFTRSDKVIPFGHGKRSCPGESLAQAEIFLFTVTTLQKFILKAPVKFDGRTYASFLSNLPEQPAKVILEAR